jgi:hypothetical protein
MKGIQDFAASKVRNQNYNQKRLSINSKCKVRLPELPLEVWGPFVFVLADAASGGSVPSVKAQLQAIQVRCLVTTACDDRVGIIDVDKVYRTHLKTTVAGKEEKLLGVA